MAIGTSLLNRQDTRTPGFYSLFINEQRPGGNLLPGRCVFVQRGSDSFAERTVEFAECSVGDRRSRERHNALMDGIEDPADLQEELGLFGSRADPVMCAYDGRRCIEIVEAELGQVGGDIVHDIAAFDRFIDQNDFAGLLDRGNQLVIIQRIDGTQVDDLSIHPVSLELLRGIKSLEQGRAEGDHRQVLAFFLDVGFADRDFIVAFRHAFGVEAFAFAVELLALEEDDRIGSRQSGIQQTFGIVWGDRIDDLQTGM